MLKLFDYLNPRAYLIARIKQMPNDGYGQARKLAEHLGVHTTLVSQILLGKKNLTTDQGILVADFLNLSELETEYFVALINLERAGNEPMRRFARKQVERLKKKSDELANRVSVSKALSEEERAIFYSDWMYTAVRQMTALPDGRTIEAIASELKSSPKRVAKVVEFLLATGLCKESDGTLEIGARSTHVSSQSPWARVHHRNWRERAIVSMDQDRTEHVHYTTPMTLSEKDAATVRAMAIAFMEEVYKVVDPSPSEKLYCLNLDWFKI